MRGYAFKFGLSCSAIWILVKMILFLSGKSIDGLDFAFLSSNFLLLSSIALTIFFTKRAQNFREVPNLDDIKAGIFGGVVYTLVIVVFSYVYNSSIDSSVLQDKIESRTQLVAQAIESEEAFKNYINQNPEASKYTREQIIERERESSANFLNPRVSALIYLMGDRKSVV